jgi:hypothetical protein
MRIAASPGSRFLALSLLVLAYPAAARAWDDPPPSTLTLDRMDSASRAGVQIGFDKLDRVSLSDGFVMRIEPFGQLVLPNRVVGIYGMLPIAHVFDFNSSDVTGTGNIEGGAFFLPFHDSTLVLRAGLALGTASSSGDEVAANFLAAYERTTDFMLVAPEYTSLRVSGSTVQQAGIAFLRIDLGLDLAVDKPEGANSVFAHANLAAGLRTPMVDLSAELVTYGTLDGSGSLSRRFMHSLAAGLRTRGPNQFCAGMVFPLDDGPRGEIWILSLGFQHVI